MKTLLSIMACLIALPLYGQGTAYNALPKISGQLNPTDFSAIDQNGPPNNPGTATLAQQQAYFLGPSAVWNGSTIGVTGGGTGAQFLNGLIKGNGTLPFASAISTDVISLFTGTCNNTTFLRADGSCAAPAGSGTVTTTGSPVSGNVAAFSGATSIAPATSANVASLWSGCSSSTYLRGDGVCATPAGAGTVTSVGLAVPTWLTVTGSPITGSGNISVSATTGIAGNQFLATPNGSTGGVALRAIVAADLPLIPLASGVSGTLPTGNLPSIPLTTGVTGILPSANGGTGVNNGSNTLTISGNPAKFASPTSGNIGTLEVVPSSSGSPCLNVNYPIVLADNGRMLCNSSASAVTFTIPANASVAFPIGTTLLFLNPCSMGVMTIAITSDALYLSPTGATGSRTLAACGAATAFKYGTTTWMIFGNGIT